MVGTHFLFVTGGKKMFRKSFKKFWVPATNQAFHVATKCMGNHQSGMLLVTKPATGSLYSENLGMGHRFYSNGGNWWKDIRPPRRTWAEESEDNQIHPVKEKSGSIVDSDKLLDLLTVIINDKELAGGKSTGLDNLMVGLVHLVKERPYLIDRLTGYEEAVNQAKMLNRNLETVLKDIHAAFDKMLLVEKLLKAVKDDSNFEEIESELFEKMNRSKAEFAEYMMDVQNEMSKHQRMIDSIIQKSHGSYKERDPPPISDTDLPMMEQLLHRTAKKRNIANLLKSKKAMKPVSLQSDEFDGDLDMETELGMKEQLIDTTAKSQNPRHLKLKEAKYPVSIQSNEFDGDFKESKLASFLKFGKTKKTDLPHLNELNGDFDKHKEYVYGRRKQLSHTSLETTTKRGTEKEKQKQLSFLEHLITSQELKGSYREGKKGSYEDGDQALDYVNEDTLSETRMEQLSDTRKTADKGKKPFDIQTLKFGKRPVSVHSNVAPMEEPDATLSEVSNIGQEDTEYVDQVSDHTHGDTRLKMIMEQLFDAGKIPDQFNEDKQLQIGMEHLYDTRKQVPGHANEANEANEATESDIRMKQLLETRKKKFDSQEHDNNLSEVSSTGQEDTVGFPDEDLPETVSFEESVDKPLLRRQEEKKAQFDELNEDIRFKELKFDLAQNNITSKRKGEEEKETFDSSGQVLEPLHENTKEPWMKTTQRKRKPTKEEYLKMSASVSSEMDEILRKAVKSFAAEGKEKLDGLLEDKIRPEASGLSPNDVVSQRVDKSEKYSDTDDEDMDRAEITETESLQALEELGNITDSSNNNVIDNFKENILDDSKENSDQTLEDLKNISDDSNKNILDSNGIIADAKETMNDETHKKEAAQADIEDNSTGKKVKKMPKLEDLW